MTVLLCFDGFLFSIKNQYYVREQTYTIIERYLRVFGKITLALRCDVIEEFDVNGYIIVDDCRIDVLPLPFFRGPLQYAKKYFSVRAKLKKAVCKCDCAIFRLPSTVGFVACDFMQKSRKPFLVEVVANPNEIKKSSKGVAKILMEQMNKSLKIACSRALGVSYVTKINLQEQYPSNDGAALEFYSSVELNKEYFHYRHPYIEHKPFRMVHVANYITPADSKGNVVAMKVLRELTDRGLDAVLYFVGERTQKGLLNDVAQELNITSKVSFIGRLSRTDLRETLIDSDLLIFPSRSEGLPRTVIEAIAVGLPCVVSNVGGIRELVTDNVIFEIEDFIGMADIIQEIIENQDLYNQLSYTNYQTSLMYESSILEKKRDRFYSTLINKI